MNQFDQKLIRHQPTKTEKEYALFDDDGIYISFNTAQEAFDWINEFTPGLITKVSIRSNTMTEGESIISANHIHYNTGLDPM